MRTVMIVDEYPLGRYWLRNILEGVGFEVVAETDDEKDVPELAMLHTPDLMVFEISVSRNYIDFLQGFTVRYDFLNVLVFTTYPEEFFADSCFRSGVIGYVSKNQSPIKILEIFNSIYVEGVTSSMLGRQKVLNDVQHIRELFFLRDLSDREFGVLIRLANGQATSLITAGLNLSSGDVVLYKDRLIKKFGVSCEQELCDILRRHKLI